MLDEKLTALCNEAISAQNTQRFIEIIKRQAKGENLDEATERHLICHGSTDMIQYYLRSHTLSIYNRDVLRFRYPYLFNQYSARFKV